jgi:two-component system chemotaxis response regulator CheY
MNPPRRIVVLDDDARVRQLIQSALRPPEFEVFAFADGRDALMKLHEIRPDLILSDVWMPDVDGRLFLQVVKRSPALREVPFVFLTAVGGDGAAESAMQAGADGFLMKPFPVTMLREKVRAMLGMPIDGQVQVPPPRRDDAEASPPALPEAPREEPRKLIEGSATRPVPLLPAPPGEWADEFHGPPATHNLAQEIEGRFTMARVGERTIPVLTEAENRPHFTITTLMTSNGRPIRKIETTWQHPLERHEDLAAAQKEVRLQHEQALAALEKLGGRALTPRRVVWDPQNRLVDGKLLCWAINAIFDDARFRIGRDPAFSLLSLTYERLGRSFEVMRLFRLGSDGHVSLNQNGGGQVRQAAVVAAAEWAVAFVTTAPRVEGEAPAVTVRRVTFPRAAQLDRMGFSAAVTGVVQRLGRLPREERALPRR